ncbi:YfbU family protein [Bacillus atrophaeus]|uniref:YfbU family protein n=1 Tax=Bacillus atrophaeus TaxID=1452 RepID=UPI002E1EB9CF|nr:YfbU family protein [Bacillus atrophaeus]MED4814220.1 YfbU family protein [Bacillus atrophaeus]MED4826286.1 YfbU family protein [Bacillus atrophaeus]MED4844946.1 YfbU family protein [Bacillus atrophaeus]
MSLEFTKEQRAILINQMEILKKLDKANEKEYEQKIYALYNGFSRTYSEFFGEIEEDLDMEVQEMVYDVFNMYRSLKNSFDELSSEEQEQINKDELRFKGYSGHTEAAYLQFANFVVLQLGKYPEIKRLIDSGKLESLDSIDSRLSDYKEMLPVWKHCKKMKENQLNSDLSLEDIKEILGK